MTLLIAAGADVIGERYEYPPLTHSVGFSNIAAAKLLLDAKADVNHPRHCIIASPFNTAISVGDLEMVKLFILAGGDVTTRDSRHGNTTCLHKMVMSCRSDGAWRPMINVSQDNPNLAAKRYTAPCNFPGVLKALVDAKADVSARGPDGMTPLIAAAVKRNVEAVNALLALGASPNEEADNGRSALLIASYDGYIDVVTALIAARADVNFVGLNGITPLLTAIVNHRADVVSALIAAGADVNFTSSDPSHMHADQNPLTVSLDVRDFRIFAILKNAGAGMWELVLSQTNPLFTACTAGNSTATSTTAPGPVATGTHLGAFHAHLIPSARDEDRESALKAGVWAESLTLVKHLLAAGVNPDLYFRGRRLLTVASNSGRTDIVGELIDAGADISFKDKYGMTALQYAAKQKHRDVVALLLAKAKEIKNANK
jgi:ankyrin repeat protein